MIFLGIDIETTGLDKVKDRVTEIGFVIMEHGVEKPLHMETYFVYEPDLKTVPERITELTGITTEMLIMHGLDPLEAGYRLSQAISKFKVTHIVAQNGKFFDLPFLAEFAKRNDLQIMERPLPVIDTKEDLPEEFYENARTSSLSYMAAHLGFLNPFPHAAIFDVMTMMKILFSFDVEEVIERSKIPWVIVAANVGYQDRQLAKDRKYSWEKIGDQTFAKKWVKRIKQDRVEIENENAPFSVAVIA